MTRHEERKQVFCILFELSFHNNADIDALIETAVEERSFEATEYIKQMVLGVIENREKINSLIEQFSSGWKISRFSRVTYAILSLAIYESQFCDEIPENVAINEAVELAKEYDSDDAPSFINGILGSISRRES